MNQNTFERTYYTNTFTGRSSNPLPSHNGHVNSPDSELSTTSASSVFENVKRYWSNLDGQSNSCSSRSVRAQRPSLPTANDLIRSPVTLATSDTASDRDSFNKEIDDRPLLFQSQKSNPSQVLTNGSSERPEHDNGSQISDFSYTSETHKPEIASFPEPNSHPRNEVVRLSTQYPLSGVGYKTTHKIPQSQIDSIPSVQTPPRLPPKTSMQYQRENVRQCTSGLPAIVQKPTPLVNGNTSNYASSKTPMKPANIPVRKPSHPDTPNESLIRPSPEISPKRSTVLERSSLYAPPNLTDVAVPSKPLRTRPSTSMQQRVGITPLLPSVSNMSRHPCTVTIRKSSRTHTINYLSNWQTFKTPQWSEIFENSSNGKPLRAKSALGFVTLAYSAGKSTSSNHHAETPLPRNSYDAESSESPNDADEDLLVRGNTEDNFGFEIPRKKGQNVVIGREMPEHTYQQVTNSNRGVVDDHWGFLEVAERPSAGVYINESTADGRLKDVGETVSRHPKSSSTITEVRQVKRELSSSSKVWLPSNVEGFKSSTQKRYLNSPSPGTQPAGIVISRSPSTTPNTTSCGGARKVLTSNIEQLHHSIQAIENGLANRSLVRQFEMLKPRNSKSTMKDSQNQDNKPKNRYRDISPYDQTRVKIQGISGDYINASLIKLEIPKSNLLKEYIAAQGPLPNTCVDFWEMCWEQKSELIVMLTCVKEQGRVKCHKYWPDVNQIFEYSWIQSKSSTKGNTTFRKRITLRITNTKEDVGEEIALREFLLQREISPTNDMVPSSTSINTWRPRILTTTGDNKVFKANCNSETRRIVQLQYITWPDHGVPDHCDDLIDFVERMRQLRGEDSSVPAVVHCSAGIGRTGVVILLDTAMDIIRSGMPINPVEMVGQMRDYREMLIQTSTQFVFVCEAIVKYYSDVILKQLRARSR